jgi:hypothetical protein
MKYFPDISISYRRDGLPDGQGLPVLARDGRSVDTDRDEPPEARLITLRPLLKNAL